MCETASAKGKSNELRRFNEYPFTFKLSDDLVSRRKPLKADRPAVACAECGSVIVLGPTKAANYRKFGKAFCDIECAGDHKRWHNLTTEYQDKSGITEAREKKAIDDAEAEKLKWTCCDWCWKAFKRANKTSRLCSMRCQLDDNNNRKRLNIIEFRKDNPRTVHDLHCDWCGKKSKSLNSTTKFCSSRCCKRSAKRNREHRMRVNGPYEVISMKWLIGKHEGECVRCGVKCTKPDGTSQQTEWTIDHMVPVSKGGLHVKSNVQLMCRQCNTKKSDSIKEGQQLMLNLRECASQTPVAEYANPRDAVFCQNDSKRPIVPAHVNVHKIESLG